MGSILSKKSTTFFLHLHNPSSLQAVQQVVDKAEAPAAQQEIEEDEEEAPLGRDVSAFVVLFSIPGALFWVSEM